MAELTANDPAVERLSDLLDYVEQVVRLDERPAMRLGEHKLPTGQAFVVHQHELHALPGVRHDLIDEDGPIWVAVERLRGAPPQPPEAFIEWLDVTPDPDRQPHLREFLIRTVAEAEKDALVEGNAARPEDCTESHDGKRAGLRFWDVRLRIEDRPELRAAAEAWIADEWLPWAVAERPVRRSLGLYQKLFEIVQLSELGGGERPFELVWGIGLARWLSGTEELDLPLVERLVEIEIDDSGGAEIRVRPRATGAIANLAPYERMGVERVSLALDASRRALTALDPDEGVSPYRRETFEPILRVCQARLDAEGVYLPDRMTIEPDQPIPLASERLSVSDRWVLFARRRSNNFLLDDIGRLKESIQRAAESGTLPGPARTLVMGPSQEQSQKGWGPLGDRIGTLLNQTFDGTAAAIDAADLFFPKPFNDEQVAIVKRLETTDGVVVQGPPGTGKTHTISNLICHYMATGRRVLVVSHGEPALAVLRAQLPSGVRDLAISVTATEREGFRQLETAVRFLQSVAEGIKPN